MSKLKVSLTFAIRLLKAPILPYRLKFQQLYLIPLVKSFKLFSYFQNESDDRHRFSKLWIPRINKTHIPYLITHADKLHEDQKYLEVYELLNSMRTSKEPKVLWRIARALYNLSSNENITKKVKMRLISEAQVLLRMALTSGGVENSDVHKWMAIILDEYYSLMNLENRVKFSTVVQYHLKKACELNPQDYTVHYMLGRWYYQMSRLSWFQRIIAKYLIASEPPKCDYEQAYKYLSRAEELQPRTMVSNLYFLGSTCIYIGQYFKAKYYLNLVLSLKPHNETDRSFIIKAKHLIRKLDRYDLSRNNVLFYVPLDFNDY